MAGLLACLTQRWNAGQNAGKRQRCSLDLVISKYLLADLAILAVSFARMTLVTAMLCAHVIVSAHTVPVTALNQTHPRHGSRALDNGVIAAHRSTGRPAGVCNSCCGVQPEQFGLQYRDGEWTPHG